VKASAYAGGETADANCSADSTRSSVSTLRVKFALDGWSGRWCARVANA
jgi:hypothetical protein